MMNTILIYFTESTSKLSDYTFDHYLQKLPRSEQEKIKAFRRWEDAQSSLLGKMLLKKVLYDCNLGEHGLDQIQLTQFGRPYINSTIDFNLTHSGNYILCASTQNGRLGIDIEKINPIQLADYRSVFNAKEWDSIVNSPSPKIHFYKLWTIKEAVLKAQGNGLSFPPNQVEALHTTINIEGKQWHYHTIELNENYICHLATDIICPEILLIQMNMNHLDELLPAL